MVKFWLKAGVLIKLFFYITKRVSLNLHQVYVLCAKMVHCYCRYLLVSQSTSEWYHLVSKYHHILMFSINLPDDNQNCSIREQESCIVRFDQGMMNTRFQCGKVNIRCPYLLYKVVIKWHEVLVFRFVVCKPVVQPFHP